MTSPTATSEVMTSPLTPDEIAAVRRPYRAASLLPGRAYHDPSIGEADLFDGDIAAVRLPRGTDGTTTRSGARAKAATRR
jgi:hypothetical protein